MRWEEENKIDELHGRPVSTSSPAADVIRASEAPLKYIIWRDVYNK